MPAQATGVVEGRVSLERSGEPIPGAEVLLVELGRSETTDAEGRYRFDGVPPGRYQILSHLDSIFTEAKTAVEVIVGETAEADFQLNLAAQRHEITVTAGERQETAFESFQDVESLDSFELTERQAVSLGEALDQRVGSGIAKRSFGPGSARPIIRGFDGDRVLIMQDGIRTGTLSSQSGDHGEALNVAQIDRLEIVKGPATLLYGSSALGGTVNAISRHHDVHVHAHEGLRGSLTTAGGVSNALRSGNGSFEYGFNNWMIWGSGGGVFTGDYNTPVGEIFNSRAETVNATAGFGYYGDRFFSSFGVQSDNGRYGVPFAGEFHGHDHEGEEEEEHEGEDHDEEEDLERVSLDTRRLSYDYVGGLRNLPGFLQSFVLKLRYVDWRHDELEFFETGEQQLGTRFNQSQFVYRGVFEQSVRGPWSGRVGFWGMERDYDAEGEEALSPPVDHSGFAAFGLEELNLERVKFQFGGRIETNRYNPGVRPTGSAGDLDGLEPGEVRERRFTGASAAAGVHAKLWEGGAVVANYARAYRAPALEELYNFGPHVGNLAFEVGDADLGAETGDGLDFSVRHDLGRLRAETNFFYYGFDNFVFPFDSGLEQDGLRVIEYTQRQARFAGMEASAGLEFVRNLWLNFGVDFVDARDTDTDTPLPRIPPMRGKLGFDWHWQGLVVKPELIVASPQEDLFPGETRTAGYAVVGLDASYTFGDRHRAHQLSVNVFNLGDRLYRNHSSFIKDLAPEIGRGVKVAYTVRFF